MFSVAFFLCLLRFNALPSDQVYLASVFLLFIAWFFLNPARLLITARTYPAWICLFSIGPIYLLITSFAVSYWPWFSLWLSLSFLLLPLTVYSALAYGLSLNRLLLSFIVAVVANSTAIIFLALNSVARPAGLLVDPNLAADFCALAILSTMFLQRSGSSRIFRVIRTASSVT